MSLKLSMQIFLSNILEHGKYYGKKKNIKKNDFLIFDFTITKYKRKSNIIKTTKKIIYF